MPAVADAVSRRQYVEEFFVARSKDRKAFLLGEPMPLEHPACQFVTAARVETSPGRSVFAHPAHESFPSTKDESVLVQ